MKTKFGKSVLIGVGLNLIGALAASAGENGFECRGVEASTRAVVIARVTKNSMSVGARSEFTATVQRISPDLPDALFTYKHLVKRAADTSDGFVEFRNGNPVASIQGLFQLDIDLGDLGSVSLGHDGYLRAPAAAAGVIRVLCREVPSL